METMEDFSIFYPSIDFIERIKIYPFLFLVHRNAALYLLLWMQKHPQIWNILDYMQILYEKFEEISSKNFLELVVVDKIWCTVIGVYNDDHIPEETWSSTHIIVPVVSLSILLELSLALTTKRKLKYASRK